jgi:hypothetical protein
VSEHVWRAGCLGVDVRVSGSRDWARLHEAIRPAGITRVGSYGEHFHIGVGDYIDASKFPPNAG